MKQQPLRLYLLAVIMFLGMAGLAMRLMQVSQKKELTETGTKQGRYLLHLSLSTGTVYDRYMKPLTNSEDVIYAAASPSAQALAPYFSILKDRDIVSESIKSNAPFVCELTENADSSGQVCVLQGKKSKDGVLPAQHLIGYRQNGIGIAGLEASFSDWLTLCDSDADISLSVSARGDVLAGAENSVRVGNPLGGGIVTTLDKRMQQITDAALSEIHAQGAAAIVLDCKSGDILASSSYPVYDPQHLADAMNAPNAPFLNRVLCAYNVGSVFKLVTAAAALESGITSGYRFDCSGQTEVYGQRFRCHRLSGHGLLDMEQAMIESCNPYFISLSSLISASQLWSTADALGFGKEVVLAEDLASVKGNLPSVQELTIEAEKANLSFGQGQLLASPLQICAMTACIANNGVYSYPRLVIGETSDGLTPMRNTAPKQCYGISADTSAVLREMMCAVLRDDAHENGRPYGISAGGKTSTAQTGQYEKEGIEYCHAWMTGFFPEEDPQYAVTVFVENGGSGNQAAAPVFRRIIEEISRLQ